MAEKRGFVYILQEYSIPLIAGVLAALAWANINYDAYHAWVHMGLLDWLCESADSPMCMEVLIDDHGHEKTALVVAILGHHLTLHFLINDIFMLFFFGVAAKEITEAILPGGALNPPSKAINPLLACAGGVVGPVAAYIALTHVFYGGTSEFDVVHGGWGIPTATDIALAWLVARVVFGATHPAVNFLLLLAVADDAIGLVIIAVFYGDPNNPARPAFLALVLAGMVVAWYLRRRGTKSWIPYVALGGVLSWVGLLEAHLHPALALVPIIPFLPGPRRDTGFFKTKDEVDEAIEAAEESGATVAHADEEHSTLHRFEHDLKLFVDLGLFLFGFCNAGVAVSSVNPVTWIVLLALLIGKTAGVTIFSVAAKKMGFGYPTGMRARHIVVAGMVAGIGLTVALFVAGEAFPQPEWQGPAKMGALLSGVAAAFAWVMGRAMKVKELEND